jgi:DNA-directed RNA polymerase specialized sigma24 family protein
MRDWGGLIERAKAGDCASVASLYQRYAPHIRTHRAGRVDGSAWTTEDLASEVFVLALTRLDSYEPDAGPIDTWLLQIADELLSMTDCAPCQTESAGS